MSKEQYDKICALRDRLCTKPSGIGTRIDIVAAANIFIIGNTNLYRV